MAQCELMGEFTTLFCYSSVCYIPLLLSFFPQVASIPRVTFILLISPAAKITACRSRIGLLPIRLTHYSGPKKVGTILSLHIVGLYYLKQCNIEILKCLPYISGFLILFKWKSDGRCFQKMQNLAFELYLSQYPIYTRKYSTFRVLCFVGLLETKFGSQIWDNDAWKKNLRTQ